MEGVAQIRGWCLGFGIAVLGGCAHGAGGQPLVVQEGPTGIAVVGEGEAEAVPDTATFRIGVEARAASVSAAREAAARTQQVVLEALRGAGVGAPQIQTTRLTVAPEYEYTDEGRRLLGYVVTNTVEVRTGELDRLARILDVALTAGGDLVRLEGLRFELEDAESVRAEARGRAVEQARARASQLASLLGVGLGPPESIEELSASAPSPVVMRLEAAEARERTPIEPGMTELRVEVRVRWAIAR